METRNAVAPAPDAGVRIRQLNAWYAATHVVKNVSLAVQPNRVTALIGPSGCGKSTLIRCINRMHEAIAGARAEGEVLINGQDVYAPKTDPVAVRRAVGMVFQKPNPFPTMSVYDNVAAGLRLNGARTGTTLDAVVEQSLKDAALWDEVKDKLGAPGTSLSGGQQQRLCIARALAVRPGVLLLDEPCSALDPIATARIEELLVTLKNHLTIVLVTHNMQQAARVSDTTGFLLYGELIEFGLTETIFSNPADSRTQDYITGRFG